MVRGQWSVVSSQKRTKEMEIRIDTADDARLAKLLETAGRMQERALTRLVRTIAAAANSIAGTAVNARFSGKGPFPVSQNKLGIRTGRLRRSIRSTKPQLNLRTGEISVSFGSNVVYFAIHEFGFQGDVQVKGHTRRAVGRKFNNRGRLTKATTERMKKNLRSGGSSATQVRPHKRRLKVNARAPLGTQLKHVSTRLAFLKALRSAIEPMLKLG